MEQRISVDLSLNWLEFKMELKLYLCRYLWCTVAIIMYRFYGDGFLHYISAMGILAQIAAIRLYPIYCCHGKVINTYVTQLINSKFVWCLIAFHFRLIEYLFEFWKFVWDLNNARRCIQCHFNILGKKFYWSDDLKWQPIPLLN